VDELGVHARFGVPKPSWLCEALTASVLGDENAIQVQLFCLGAATSVAILVAMSDMAAASAWGYQHPRRAEVNHRSARQNHRIDREFHEGEITRLQARQLHRKDHFVRREERFMASQHYGHITRAEQRFLNQQENGIGRQIGN
jgi:hypothetical protein